jgi:predicted transposase YdaD
MKSKNRSALKKEGNVFDKILKEHLDDIFIPLIEAEFGSKIKTKKILNHKLQTTLEREVDYLFEVTLENGNRFILHIEFQTSLSQDLVYRMGEYNGILKRKYRLKIEHVIVYLGEKSTKIKMSLNESEIFRSFRLIRLHEKDPTMFLESENPADLLISILCKIPKEQIDDYLSLLIEKVKNKLQDEGKINKFVQQMLIFSRLRNFDNVTLNKIKKMPVAIDVKKDILFNLGIEEGRQEGREEGREKGLEAGLNLHEQKVLKNCVSNGYAIKDIAIILGVSVQKINGLKRKYNIK